MATHSGSTIWDIEQSLRRLGPDHYGRYRETHQRVAVMGNALQGLPLRGIYHNPARETVAALLANTDRPGMVSEKLLTHAEQQRLLGALQAVEAALEAADPGLTLYTIATRPGSEFPEIMAALAQVDAATPKVCVPFVQADYDPARAAGALDALLDLIGDRHTLIDLYDRQPAVAWRAAFNGVMVRARRAGLLVELRGIWKPPAPGYISDPADSRWDVRSCVAPENAALYKDVHVRINTMAYLMDGLTYGDFFDLPMADDQVLPHFKRRVAADKDYWFTALERDRVSAAIDDILAYLASPGAPAGLTLREVYSDPDAPREVLIAFQRMLDVKPELCLPFMLHTWDHAEAGAAIDVFLTKNRDRTLKALYTSAPDPAKPTYTQSEYELILQQRNATRVLLQKSNDLRCYNPGECLYEPYDYCSSNPYGNCQP